MKNLSLFVLLLFGQIKTFACTCAPDYDARGFCQVVHEAKDKPMFCVVKVRVISYYQHGIYALVLDNIYNTPANDTILVWGDNGACCRPTFAGLAAIYPNDTIVMSLEQTDLMANFIVPGPPDYEDSTDYVLQGCGAYFMRCRGNQVIGGFNANGFDDTLAYTDFRTQTIACITAVGMNENNKPSLNVFPNPFNSVVQLTADENIELVNIYNTAGEMVMAAKPNQAAVQLQLHGLPGGLYLFMVYTAGKKEPVWYKLLHQ